MKVEPAQIRAGLGLAILLAEMLAPRTETKLDDQALALLKKLEASTSALAIIAALLSGQPPQAGLLSVDDAELYQSLAASPEALAALHFAGAQIK